MVLPVIISYASLTNGNGNEKAFKRVMNAWTYTIIIMAPSPSFFFFFFFQPSSDHLFFTLLYFVLYQFLRKKRIIYLHLHLNIIIINFTCVCLCDHYFVKVSRASFFIIFLSRFYFHQIVNSCLLFLLIVYTEIVAIITSLYMCIIVIVVIVIHLNMRIVSIDMVEIFEAIIYLMLFNQYSSIS